MPFIKLMTLVALFSLSGLAIAEPNCTTPELSKDQLLDIIAYERSHRSDLPKAFTESEYTINRHGCYYVVIESAIPLRPGKNILFKLNQNGIIVDVMRGR